MIDGMSTDMPIALQSTDYVKDGTKIHNIGRKFGRTGIT